MSFKSWVNKYYLALTQRCHSGLVALEFLASTAITIPALLTLAVLLSRGIHMLGASRSYALQANLDVTLEQIAHRIIEDSDAHPLALIPRAHAGGFITFADGSLNQVHALRNGRAPDTDTSSITYLSLDTARTLVRKATMSSGVHPTLKMCPRYDQPLTPEDYKSYLAVSGDGIFEVLAALKRAPPSNCWQATLSATRSMITNTTSPIYNSDFLIPIREVYTYYKDQNGILRILSHKGDMNIENQPLLNSLGTISFEVEASGTLGLFQLSSKYSRPDTTPHSFTRTNTIGRNSYLSFALNRP